MIKVEDKKIHLTRGDIAVISTNAKTQSGEPYTFRAGDIVRLRVMRVKDVNQTLMSKSVTVKHSSDTVEISLTKKDTAFDEPLNRPKVYWYEIELNPDTFPQTLVGWDEDGPKELILYPEGADLDG